MNRNHSTLLLTIKRLRSIAASAVFALLAVLLCGNCGGASQPPARGPGDGPAASAPRFETLRVKFLRAMGDGKVAEVGKLERPVTDYGDRAVSLLVRTMDTKPKDGAARGRTHVEQRFEVGRERIELPPTDIECTSPPTCVVKEWLELELAGPGATPRRVERLLRVSNNGRDPIPAYRRYTVVAAPGAITRDEARRRIDQSIPELKIEERTAKVRELQSEARDTTEDKAKELVARMDDLDAGGELAHLVVLGFAAESDAATAQLAAQAGVHDVRATPRIIVASAEAKGTEDRPTFALDLRLDEVDTAPGDDAAAARSFQLARGLQESALEGKYLEVVLGDRQAVSTAALMNAALRDNIAFAAVTPDTKNQLGELKLPEPFAKLVVAALDAGHQVVLPRTAVRLAGRMRWGFWDIDPENGRTIGVMEGGQRQGMVEIPVTTTGVPLNPAMGFVLGLHAGAVVGQLTLASLILKYGDVTPQLIQEMTDIVKQIACTACPEVKVEAKVEIKTNDCLKQDLLKFAKGGLDFCSKYQDGFKCAAAVIVMSLTKTDPPNPHVKITPPTITIACAEFKAE